MTGQQPSTQPAAARPDPDGYEGNRTDPPPAPLKPRAGAGTGFSPRLPRLGKPGCTVIVLSLLLGSLVTIFLSGMVEQPPLKLYRAQPVRNPKNACRIRGEFYLWLPPGWKRVHGNIFAGPDGSRLRVRHGNLRFFRMQPHTLGGKPQAGLYTAAAYAHGLRLRARGSKPGDSCYFRMPPFKGVEAWVKLGGGGVRGFAVILPRPRNSSKRQQVLELRFSLPSGPGSRAWRQAETILASLARIKRPASRKTPAPQHSSPPAAAGGR